VANVFVGLMILDTPYTHWTSPHSSINFLANL